MPLIARGRTLGLLILCYSRSGRTYQIEDLPLIEDIAQHGQAALALLAHHHATVALVLIDLTMPQMSGAEAYPHIRHHYPDLPVILMSSYPAEEARTHFRNIPMPPF
jgi:CheY-like chemotaxis protein